MHDRNCFITLTYNDEHYEPSLNYRDWQLFMYRVRQKLGPTRFFMCGEYGDLNDRPHFHAILFGRYFDDRDLIGKNLYRSNELDKLWTKGYSSFGGVSYQSAAYVAGYVFKKQSGNYIRSSVIDERTGEIVDRSPETGRMSLKPGIGYSWFNKYCKEVLVRDRCVLPGGKMVPLPKYYDRLIEKLDGDLADDIYFKRYVHAQEFLADTTPERLRVREACAKAQIKQKERRL